MNVDHVGHVAQSSDRTTLDALDTILQIPDLLEMSISAACIYTQQSCQFCCQMGVQFFAGSLHWVGTLVASIRKRARFRQTGS